MRSGLRASAQLTSAMCLRLEHILLGAATSEPEPVEFEFLSICSTQKANNHAEHLKSSRNKADMTPAYKGHVLKYPSSQKGSLPSATHRCSNCKTLELHVPYTKRISKLQLPSWLEDPYLGLALLRVDL